MERKKLALEEYRESKDAGHFRNIAQKLAQHLNNLSQDKRTRVRWIWELIQNAKDVPNEFGKTRIRIQIRENKLIFAHNGNPFRVSDLESIVSQYSSKREQNNANAETTGKYGTGFITTYILSRKIRVKGLLVVRTAEQRKGLAPQQGGDSDDDQLEIKEDINSKPKIGKKYQFKPKQEREEEEQGGQNQKKKKRGQNKWSDGSLYQRFQIFLDRQFKDRDSQLYQKLMQTQHNLMDDLSQNEAEPRWQRKQGQLNTQFIYEDLDEAAFKMVTEAIAHLKELFPYAILFNPKLFQVQVIDKRQGKRIKNFGIRRQEDIQQGKLSIFNCLLMREGQQNKVLSLAYMQDEQTYSTIAVPIELDGHHIKLLQVNHKLPKIFKEFPLIGCKDVGFNFVFTSKKFYPNESRSDLLLNSIEGRINKRAQSNWQSITGIFNKARELYKNLASATVSGHQKLLILTLENQFTSQQYANRNIREILRKFYEQIGDYKAIQFRNERKGTLKELIYPRDESKKKQVSPKEFSQQLNATFAIVLGEGNVLPDATHENFYLITLQYQKVWNKKFRYISLSECLTLITNLQYDGLKIKCGGEPGAITQLGKIYELLNKHHPSYLNQNKNLTQAESQKGYVLTQKLVFKNLWAKYYFGNLMIEKDLPDGYKEIADILEIDFRINLIHKDLDKWFINVKIFGIPQILNKFRNCFFEYVIYQNKQIILLGRFIHTFGIKSASLSIAQEIRQLSGVAQKLQLKSQENFKMSQKDTQDYKLMFDLRVLFFAYEIIKNSKDIKDLKNSLTITDTKKAIGWLNRVFAEEDRITRLAKANTQIEVFRFVLGDHFVNDNYQKGTQVAKKFPLITVNLAMNLNFYNLKSLLVFCKDQGQQKYYKGDYPNNRDIQFHQQMRLIENSSLFKPSALFKPSDIKSLKKIILHQQIQWKFPVATTFKIQYNFTIQLYQQLNSKKKLQFLDYVMDISDEAKRDPSLQFKRQTFFPIISKAFYQYPVLTNCLKPNDQEFIYRLIRKPEELSSAQAIMEKYGLANALQKLQDNYKPEKK